MPDFPEYQVDSEQFLGYNCCMNTNRNVGREWKYDEATNTATFGEHRMAQVHPAELCEGRGCTIHHPSDHHLRHLDQHWRADRGLMERTCSHGIGHPDPDDPKTADEYESIHGCDGCCALTETVDAQAILEDDTSPPHLRVQAEKILAYGMSD